MNPWLEGIALFGFGSCVGSFLNVCILRWPLGISIIHPASRCSACGVKIPLSLNLPILGYFLLRGRARCCGAHLDPRYPVVELLTAILFTNLWFLYPPELFFVYAVLTAGLIVASGIDFDHLVIPDGLTLGGVVAGISLSYFLPELQQRSDPTDAMIRSTLSAAVGGGFLYGLAKTASWLLQKEAMGAGDAKLLAALGAFLGWNSLPWILAASSLFGTAVGLAILLRRRQKLGVKIPYGPYLALASLLWILGGKSLIAKYLFNNSPLAGL
jgi:leader peptidase (prepilin peptidase)/N-methyltransferase